MQFSVFTGTHSQYYSMVSVLLFLNVSSYSILIFLIPTTLPWQVVFLSRLVPGKLGLTNIIIGQNELRKVLLMNSLFSNLPI